MMEWFGHSISMCEVSNLFYKHTDRFKAIRGNGFEDLKSTIKEGEKLFKIARNNAKDKLLRPTERVQDPDCVQLNIFYNNNNNNSDNKTCISFVILYTRII
jgi:hypothetical protein